MKHSKTCPKCAGIRLLHIRQVADRMGDSYHPHTHPRPVPTPVSTEHSDEWRLARVPGQEPNTMANVGRVEAYVCRACGFTEFYTRDLDDIPIDGHYVKAIEGTQPPPSR